MRAAGDVASKPRRMAVLTSSGSASVTHRHAHFTERAAETPRPGQAVLRPPRSSR